jgi:hypothetical protein
VYYYFRKKKKLHLLEGKRKMSLDSTSNIIGGPCTGGKFLKFLLVVEGSIVFVLHLELDNWTCPSFPFSILKNHHQVDIDSRLFEALVPLSHQHRML